MSLLFKHSAWIVVPFASLFYALMIFDTLGDAVGWRAALWVPIVIVLLPLFVWLLLNVKRSLSSDRFEARHRRLSSRDSDHGEPLLFGAMNIGRDSRDV
jgi:MFS family permease